MPPSWDVQGVGTISNDDVQPTLAIGDVQLQEGNTGTTGAVFVVSLSASSYQAITVNYATADGNATAADGDYVSANGTLTIPAGQASGTIPVLVNGDTKYELNETFALNLSATTNATISDAQAVGTVLNDDSPPTISVADPVFWRATLERPTWSLR